MAEDRIDSFIDLAALDKQKKILLASLDEIAKKVIDTNRVLKESNLTIAGANDVKTLVKEVEMLRNKTADLTSQQKQAEQTIEQLNKVKMQEEKINTALAAQDALRDRQMQQLTNTLKSNSVEVTRLKEANKNLQNVNKVLYNDMKNNVITKAEYTKRVAENSLIIDKNKVAISNLNAEQKRLIKEQEAVPTSMDAMSVSVARLEADYRRLSEEQRLSPMGVKMASDIKSMNEQLRVGSMEIGNFKANIGNYDSVVKTANLSLGEMRKLIREMKNASYEGMDDDQIQQHERSLAQLIDRYDDANGVIRSMSADTLPAVINSFQMLVAAAQIYTGVATAFGVNEEHARKLQQTMVGLIGVSQALKTVYEGLEKKTFQVGLIKMKNAVIFGALAVKKGVLTAATWLLVAAQNALTASVKLFSKAIYGIPVFGWILLAITAITAAVVALVKRWENVTNAFRKLGQFLGISSKEIENNTTKVRSLVDVLDEKHKAQLRILDEGRHELALMKARGAGIDEIKKKERELIALEIQSLELSIRREIATGRYTSERHKKVNEDLKALKVLRRELEIFDVTEQTRQNDLAKENTKKRREQGKQERENQIKLRNEAIENLKQQNLTILQLEQQKIDDLAKIAKTNLDFQHKQALLEIEQRYADKLLTEKEYNKSLLTLEHDSRAAELALLKFNLKEKQKQNENELNAKIKLFERGLLSWEEYENRKKEIDKENKELLKEVDNAQLDYERWLAQEKIKINKEELTQKQLEYDKYLAFAEEKAKEAEELTLQMGTLLGQSLLDREKGMKQFMKGMSVMLLDMAEKQLIATLFTAKAGSLVTPDSIATGGAAGLIRAGILTGLIRAAFAVVKSAIMKEPKGYYMGRKGGTAEFAYVGEKGAEIIDTGKEQFLTPNKKTLTFLDKGWSVIPNKETTQILNNNANMDGINRRLDKLIHLSDNTMVNNTILTEKGLQSYITKGNIRTNYIKKLRK